MRSINGIKQSRSDENASIHELVGLLYEAAVDSEKWPLFLEQLSQTTDQAFAAILTREFWPDLLNPGVTLMRGVARPAGGYSDLYRVLLRHLQRAIKLRRRVQYLEQQRPLLQEIWNHVAIGMLIVDRASLLIDANRAARAILEKRDGLLLLRDRLTAQNPSNASSLRMAIAQVPAEDHLVWIYRQRLRPLGVVVHPLSCFSGLAASAVLYLSDSESGMHPGPESLRKIYGLTSAEASLVEALLQGKSVEEYTLSAAISMNTARTHMKRALEKTGTTRQADLVRVVLTGPAILKL